MTAVFHSTANQSRPHGRVGKGEDTNESNIPSLLLYSVDPSHRVIIQCGRTIYNGVNTTWQGSLQTILRLTTDKDSLLNQTLIRLLNLLLGSSVHFLKKANFNENPARSD